MRVFTFETFPDGRLEVISMPRMSKQMKEEMDFFLDEHGRIKYAEQCRQCERDCKQSFRAVIVQCPEAGSKRRKK